MPSNKVTIIKSITLINSPQLPTDAGSTEASSSSEIIFMSIKL